MSSSDPIHIDANDDSNRAVVLTPADKDRFVQTGLQIIIACQLGVGINAWFQELAAVWSHVTAWVARNRNVRACYFSPKPSKVAIFVVPNGDHYDFELADALTELDLEMSRNFNIGAFEILQIPAAEVDRFVNLQTAKVADGAGRETHQSVET